MNLETVKLSPMCTIGVGLWLGERFMPFTRSHSFACCGVMKYSRPRWSIWKFYPRRSYSHFHFAKPTSSAVIFALFPLNSRFLIPWIIEVKPFVLYLLAPEEAHLCAFRAIAEWIMASNIMSGYLFWRMASGDHPSAHDTAMVSQLVLHTYSIWCTSSWRLGDSADVWEMPWNVLPQPPWHWNRPLTIWDPLIQTWWVSVLLISAQMESTAHLWLGWMEHRI